MDEIRIDKKLDGVVEVREYDNSELNSSSKKKRVNKRTKTYKLDFDINYTRERT